MVEHRPPPDTEQQLKEIGEQIAVVKADLRRAFTACAGKGPAVGVSDNGHVKVSVGYTPTAQVDPWQVVAVWVEPGSLPLLGKDFPLWYAQARDRAWNTKRFAANQDLNKAFRPEHRRAQLVEEDEDDYLDRFQSGSGLDRFSIPTTGKKSLTPQEEYELDKAENVSGYQPPARRTARDYLVGEVGVAYSAEAESAFQQAADDYTALEESLEFVSLAKSPDGLAVLRTKRDGSLARDESGRLVGLVTPAEPHRHWSSEQLARIVLALERECSRQHEERARGTLPYAEDEETE